MTFIPPMDRCPTEIWNHIFSFACTDDGFTGRSLSLTSRNFHETSKSVKFQSLSVTKPQQILSLARLLADTEPKYRRVRHLFIACSHVLGDDEGVVEIREGSLSVASTDGIFRHTAEEFHVKSVLVAFLHIIRAVAPTIMILYVHLESCRACLLFPISIPFPSLVELTLYGPCLDYGQLSAPLYAGGVITSPTLPDCPLPMPSLRRLHLADSCGNPTKCFGRIASVAPSLTHVSLPFHGSFSTALLAVLDIRPDSSSNSFDDAVGTLPSTVQTVLIDASLPSCLLDPTFPFCFQRCGSSYRRRTKDIQKFEAITKEDTRVYMLKERPNGIKDAERFWLDRIEGSDGAWTVTRRAA